MCGIAGIISPDSSLVNASRLQQMTDALAHRGPDGEGQWINENGTVALGHRRLAIIDLSEAACQPMHYLNRYSIVHNGEIYNYIELQEALQKKGYSFFSKTDTEVIAAAYDCWGEDCVLQFDGMFAFAVWDEKEKTLFAARDRYGEKPFYFYRDDEQFLFASEMKAFWTAGVERKINRKLLFNFLTIGYADNPDRPEETFFVNISKLPAASILKFSIINFQCSIFNYWDIETENENKKITDEEAIEQFRFLFQQSVKRRLRSDVPFGTSLSGGLDSSSVAAMIHALAGNKDSYKCFSAVFPSFEKDEYSFSKKIAEKFGLQHITVQPGAASLAADFEKLFYHQEEPFGSASIYAQYKVYELASRQEVKVLLDGQGADETLAGYHKYYKWYWQELFKKRKLAGSRELQAAKKLGVTERFGWKNRVAALFPEFAAIVLEKQFLLHALRHEDLTREFIRLQSKEAYYETPDIFSLNGVLYFNTCIHGLEELLRYADRNSMAHGREIRLPFLNHELTEFVFSLPSHFKIRNGWTKWLLRKTMEDSLPDEITWRRDKTGFEPPQEQWMQDEKIQQLIMDGKKKLVEEKILQPQVLNKKILPATAYDAANSDWRYLAASMLFK